MSLLERRLRWRSLARASGGSPLKIALLGTFTVDPLVPYLGTALDALGIKAEVAVGPFNQIAQQCLSDDSETARFQPRVVVVWPRLEDLWGATPLPMMDEDRSLYADEALELAEVSLEASRRWRATFIWVLPAIPDARPLGIGDACTKGVHATACHVREQIRERLWDQRGVRLVDAEEVVRTLGSERALDRARDAVARVPYSEESFSAVGDRVARLVALGEGRACKAVVLDGDGTLWGGVIGEDGPDGVDLFDNGPGHAYRTFQSYLGELQRAGVLLALCSKNAEEDVWRVFERPEMRLRREQLTTHRIGWGAKSSAIREIAQELDIGLSSIVVIDDSPVELAEVQAALPDVTCLRMPEDPEAWPDVVAASGALDRLPPTSADLARGAQYHQARARAAAMKYASTPDEYRAGLGVCVSIVAPTERDVPRLSQLIGKTNQFNLNCRRRAEAEVAGLCRDERYLVRICSARDRFGDYGVVGAYCIALGGGSTPVLDTFLLSCRALGRGIERAMIEDAFEQLERRSIATLQATVEECPRNDPARRFFEELGCSASGVASTLRRAGWPAHVDRTDAPTATGSSL